VVGSSWVAAQFLGDSQQGLNSVNLVSGNNLYSLILYVEGFYFFLVFLSSLGFYSYPQSKPISSGTLYFVEYFTVTRFTSCRLNKFIRMLSDVSANHKHHVQLRLQSWGGCFTLIWEIIRLWTCCHVRIRMPHHSPARADGILISRLPVIQEAFQLAIRLF
jgi:hypothetical protein